MLGYNKTASLHTFYKVRFECFHPLSDLLNISIITGFRMVFKGICRVVMNLYDLLRYKCNEMGA